MVCTRFLCGQFRNSLIVFICPARSENLTRSVRSACSGNLTHFARFAYSASLTRFARSARSAHSTNLTRSAYPTRFVRLALFPAIFELQAHQFPYSGNTPLPLQGPNLEPSVE